MAPFRSLMKMGGLRMRNVAVDWYDMGSEYVKPTFYGTMEEVVVYPGEYELVE
jgi:hypothetical protein